MQVGLVHFMMYPEAMAGNDDVAASIERVAADPFFDVLEIFRIRIQRFENTSARSRTWPTWTWASARSRAC